MKVFKYITGETGPILFVLTGTKRDVFIKTGCLSEYYELDELNKFIITDQDNIEIFYNLPNTKIYPMNPETFLILRNKYYSSIISSPETELSIAFVNELHQKGALGVTRKFIEINNWKYYFNQTPHPIDIVHQKLKRKGKYLVGINIGEDEHVTKKLPYSFLSDLMKNISSLINVKFVTFGTKQNELREEMLRRETNINMISMVGNYSTEMYAQAISMCDCFVSLNRFLLHLSLSVKQNTVGLFYRDEFKDEEENENMLPLLYPFVIDNKCDECDEFTECELIYKGDICCLNEFDVDEITSMILWILKGKENK